MNGQPARRLLSFASRPTCWRRDTRAVVVTSNIAVTITITIQPPQLSTRHYAVRGPSPSLAAKKKPTFARVGSDRARLIFSNNDVSPVEDWEAGLQGLQNEDLTAEQCRQGALRYVSVVTQWQADWTSDLESKHGLSPYLLHCMGCILLSRNSPDRWRLGTHMLKTASSLGFDPSALTLVRVMSSLPKEAAERASKSAIFIGANARFQDLVRQGRDPDALTLYGIILAGKGKDQQALAAFRNADKAVAVAAVGRTVKAHGSASLSGALAPLEKAEAKDSGTVPQARERRWDWELSSVLGQARIYLKRNKLAEAEKLFRVAALELDNPEGYFRLAQLMQPRDSPEREMYLVKAAISGWSEACRELGELEQLKSQKEGLGKGQVAEHEKMAGEWFNLAGSTSG